jgi:hypothetical protein
MCSYETPPSNRITLVRVLSCKGTKKTRGVNGALTSRVDAGIGTGHKTPCFGYWDALFGCLLGSAFASWSET